MVVGAHVDIGGMVIQQIVAGKSIVVGPVQIDAANGVVTAGVASQIIGG